MFSLFRLCRKEENSFDIVAETGKIVAKKRQHCGSSIRLCRKNEILRYSFDIVAVYGNKVECYFDKVERSFDSVAYCFDIVAGVDGALRPSFVGVLFLCVVSLFEE